MKLILYTCGFGFSHIYRICEYKLLGNLVSVEFGVNISSAHCDLNRIPFARVSAGKCPNCGGGREVGTCYAWHRWQLESCRSAARVPASVSASLRRAAEPSECQRLTSCSVDPKLASTSVQLIPERTGEGGYHYL